MFTGDNTAVGMSAFISFRICFASATVARHTPDVPMRSSDMFARIGTDHPSESKVSVNAGDCGETDFLGFTTFQFGSPCCDGAFV